MALEWESGYRDLCPSIVLQLHPLCCEELKKQKETWELEKILHKCLVLPLLLPLPLTLSPSSLSLLQDVLEGHLSLSHPTTLPEMTSDLLQQGLSIFLRLALHREVESGGGCDGVRERVREIREWSNRVLLPLFRGET